MWKCGDVGIPESQPVSQTYEVPEEEMGVLLWNSGEPRVFYGQDRVTGNLIVDRSFEFALRIVRFSRRLREAGWPDLARQLLRSGTSVGANVHEAQDAESRDDFIHKMKLAAKEADESRFWLKLCKYTEELPHEEGLLDDLYEISSVLSAIIIKSRQNARK